MTNTEGVNGLYRPSRAEVRQVACPDCGAEPGRPCLARKPAIMAPYRKTHHSGRVRAAERIGER